MENLSALDSRFLELNENQLLEVNGGLTIIIAGVTFVGWKAGLLIAGGVTTLAGAAALGLWNGYKDTRK